MNLFKSKFLFFIGLLTLVSSCKKSEQNFFMPAVNSRQISVVHLVLDSLKLNIETSFTGILKIRNRSIYFADSRFCWVYEFDPQGQLIGRNLGRGGGPKELKTNKIDLFEPLKDGSFFIMGPSNDCHFFDKDWNKIKTSYLNSGLTKGNKSKLKSKKNIAADEKWVYTPNYNELVTRNYDQNLFYNITAMHPYFNPVSTGELYFKSGRTIAKVDLEDRSEVTDMLGRMSPVYSEYKYLPQFISTFFDITTTGNFYVCLQADPTIYFYDKDFHILKAFGYPGKNMNTDYEELSKVSDVRKKYNQQRETCGYYTWIEFVDETNTLFRSYTKGKKQKNDGLQIYKDGVLVADLDVPKGFRVSGYIAPFYYSDVMTDLDSETMKVYKFNLNID